MSVFLYGQQNRKKENATLCVNMEKKGARIASPQVESHNVPSTCVWNTFWCCSKLLAGRSPSFLHHQSFCLCNVLDTMGFLHWQVKQWPCVRAWSLSSESLQTRRQAKGSLSQNRAPFLPSLSLLLGPGMEFLGGQLDHQVTHACCLNFDAL